MKSLLAALAASLTVLLAISPKASAQTAPTAAYTGPRYPGGPDSLRALVFRGVHSAAPGIKGQVVLQFELVDGRTPRNFKLIDSPSLLKSGLTKAAETATAYVQTHMLAWEPGAPDPKAKPGNNPRVRVLLAFDAPLATQPFPYAEQEPVFPSLTDLLRTQGNTWFERNKSDAAFLANLLPSPKGLATYLQMQTKYPAAALRNQEQGVVYLYFEVAETGAIEQAHIIGSAGYNLDDAVLYAARQLPAAITPALHLGRPVRVFYVIPSTFKIQ